MGGISKEERRARKAHAILEAMGDEPVWDPKKDESQIGSLLNWYSQNKDSDDAKNFFIAYFVLNGKPESEINLIKKLPAWEISTHGWLARIVGLTESPPEKYVDRLHEKYQKLLLITKPEVKEVKVEEKKTAPNIQDRLEEQLHEYMSEVEWAIDQLMLNGFKYDWSPMDWYKSQQIKPVQIKNLSDHYRKKVLAELLEAQSGKDEQLVEAYSHISKSEMKKFIAFVELVISDADKWYDISRQISASTRKVRVKKAKPPFKQVAKLKYLREDGEFKSIKPEEIVGAQQLWVYNIKYRTLGQYVCDNPHGFAVKGCTILNFNTVESIAKKLRKPNEIIPKLLAAGKVAQRRILPDIRAKEKKLTGRINGDTLLLKVL